MNKRIKQSFTATLLSTIIAATSAGSAFATTIPEKDGQNGLYQPIEKALPSTVKSVAGTLSNGTPVTGLSGLSGSEQFFSITLPANAGDLSFTLSGGNGDADLYVLYGSQPTTSQYDCRPYQSGNNESCTIATPLQGTYYVMIQGYSDYDGVTLNATFATDSQPAPMPKYRLSVAGDSITKAFAADCTSNYWWWQRLCPAGGDQLEHSWFDGNSSSVFSMLDRYKQFDATTVANQSAAISGSEMRGGNNNLVVQANNIINQPEKPNHVVIELGGNDICNRGCVDGANCSDPLYTDTQWRQSVRDGLNVLMQGMAQDNASILIASVPRVQDIRDAGLALQAQKPGQVDCQYLWSTYNVCSIVTAGGTYNGETLQQRHDGVAAAQKRYNEILAQEAQAYNSNSNGLNPNGIMVTAEYVDELTPSAGTFSFGAEHINGGDCFHPNVATQDLIGEMLWNANPAKPQ